MLFYLDFIIKEEYNKIIDTYTLYKYKYDFLLRNIFLSCSNKTIIILPFRIMFLFFFK